MQPLHTVSTLSASSSLNTGVRKEGDEKLHARLSTAGDGTDAHAINMNIIKTVGENMSQMCSINVLPYQTLHKQVK